jgi:hypothetical protein
MHKVNAAELTIIVIAMKSKGNNNKPIQKVVSTQTIATTKRYDSDDVSVCCHTATSQFIWSPQVVCIFVNIQLDMVKHSTTD